MGACAARRGPSVYVTYYPDIAFSQAADRVREFFGVAVDNGVKHLVLLSGRYEAGALRGEQFVQESGVDWTVVRSSFMNQKLNEGFWADSVLAGEIAAPAGDIADPFIDADDIADVATAALIDERHRNKIYDVTGPRLLNFYEGRGPVAAATPMTSTYGHASTASTTPPSTACRIMPCSTTCSAMVVDDGTPIPPTASSARSAGRLGLRGLRAGAAAAGSGHRRCDRLIAAWHAPAVTLLERGRESRCSTTCSRRRAGGAAGPF